MPKIVITSMKDMRHLSTASMTCALGYWRGAGTVESQSAHQPDLPLVPETHASRMER